MQYKGKAKQVADEILGAFEAGDVPAALAQVFIHRELDSPAARWSYRNRMIAALRGHVDARGFRQWQEVGRSVRKGERAFHILAPWTVRAKKDDEERGIEKGDPRLIGFFSIPVFGASQTDGEPLPHEEQERRFVDALPLVDVARAWGIRTQTFSGRGANSLGYFLPAGERPVIALGVENLSTWCHELVHAADHRRGTLTRAGGQQLDNEVVAEFGGAVLLETLGYPVEADRGGAWEYIQGYAQEHRREPIAVCSELIDRTCGCVALILEAADELVAAGAQPMAEAMG